MFTRPKLSIHLLVSLVLRASADLSAILFSDISA